MDLKLESEPKGQGHSRNQKKMTLGTKNMPLEKRICAEVPLVICMMLTLTAEKQYVNPNPMAGGCFQHDN